jgi:Domain of unknown function (DUF4282)
MSDQTDDYGRDTPKAEERGGGGYPSPSGGGYPQGGGGYSPQSPQGSGGYPYGGSGYPPQGTGGYPPPPGAYPTASYSSDTASDGGWRGSSGARTQEARSFLSALLDFSFESLVTTKIIKFVYIIMVALAGLYGLVLLYFAFANFAGGSIVTGLLMLIAAPLVFLFLVVLYRIALEVVMVVFRIGEDIREIRNRGGGLD